MDGVVFVSFRDFLAARLGADAARELLAGEPAYLLSESYEDERLGALVSRTAAATADDADAVVYEFGVFTAERTFARLYPAFFEIAGGARPFLLTVEDRIHQLVRATIPNARPPQLRVEPLGEDGVSIVYCSPRRLCILLRGLVEGTARWYGERAAMEEATCMRRGDDVCTFAVRLAGARVRPAAEPARPRHVA